VYTTGSEFSSALTGYGPGLVYTTYSQVFTLYDSSALTTIGSPFTLGNASSFYIPATIFFLAGSTGCSFYSFS
jgi:hypothetical protein